MYYNYFSFFIVRHIQFFIFFNFIIQVYTEFSIKIVLYLQLQFYMSNSTNHSFPFRVKQNFVKFVRLHFSFNSEINLAAFSIKCFKFGSFRDGSKSAFKWRHEIFTSWQESLSIELKINFKIALNRIESRFEMFDLSDSCVFKTASNLVLAT